MGTVVTLANGRVYALAMDYDDARQYLAVRGATGRREVELADGTRAEIAVDGIAAIEERARRERRAVGFTADWREAA